LSVQIRVAIGLCAVLFFSVNPGSTADWPQWLGPQRNAVSSETGLLKNWPAAGPQVVWRVPLGKGFSGISISQGRVYTLFANSEGEFAVCLKAENGEEVWRFQTGTLYEERQGGDGPRSTPTVDGERVYVLGARGMLYALDARTGEKVWEKDLVAAFGSEVPRWGFSTSPLVEGDLLLLEAGGVDGNFLVDMVIDREANATAVALDKATGRTVWTALGDKMSYSSPIVVTLDGLRQVVFFNAYALVGLAPQDGSVYWRFPWKTRYDVSASTPVLIAPDKLFISAGNKGAVVRVASADDGAQVEQVWKNKEMKNHFGTSIHYKGHLYGFDESILTCINAESGAQMWETRGYAKGTLVIADGHLLILGEQGNLGLAVATPEGFVEKANVAVMSGRCWTVPSLANGKIYLRDESEMVCLNIGEAPELGE